MMAVVAVVAAAEAEHKVYILHSMTQEHSIMRNHTRDDVPARGLTALWTPTWPEPPKKRGLWCMYLLCVYISP